METANDWIHVNWSASSTHDDRMRKPMYISAPNKTDLMLLFGGDLLKGSDVKYSGSSFSLKPTGNNADGIKFACGLQLRSLNIYEAWFSIFFSLLFFPPTIPEPETLQWRRGYLSVPVRHSIRTDGSSVIKMALRYNREDEDARECSLALCFCCRRATISSSDERALYFARPLSIRQKRLANNYGRRWSRYFVPVR